MQLLMQIIQGNDTNGTDDFTCGFFNGTTGPGHVLYELKIAFGNMDETFTYNETERFGKHVSAAKRRIAESKAAMDKGDEEAANIALKHYENKMDIIDDDNSGKGKLGNESPDNDDTDNHESDNDEQ
jgi:hypothetical protein